MLILVDQDGVLANFEQAFYQAWTQSPMQAEFPALLPEERRHFTRAMIILQNLLRPRVS